MIFASIVQLTDVELIQGQNDTFLKLTVCQDPPTEEESFYTHQLTHARRYLFSIYSHRESEKLYEELKTMVNAYIHVEGFEFAEGTYTYRYLTHWQKLSEIKE